MESGGAAEQPQDGATKKGPFDGLSRDELIQKLKGLLSVYKNAKQAKDEISNENTQLKETLASLQLQKSADKEYLKGLQTSIQKLNETVCILEEQKQLDKNYMKGMHEMVDEVTNEKNSLSNRVTRLSQENEKLLGDCRKTDDILRQLNDSLAEHQQQVQQLQKMCEQQKVVNTDLRNNHAAETARNDQLEAQLNSVRSKCDSHESKLKLYRTKLVDFSVQLKELRMCKEVLLTTVQEYSQAVSKWQGEILTVSKEYFEKNRNLKEENRLLEERVTSLSSIECDRCAESLKKYDELMVQFEKIVNDNKELGDIVKNIENQHLEASTKKEMDVLDGNPPEKSVNNEEESELKMNRVKLQELEASLKLTCEEAMQYKDAHNAERQLLEKKCSELEAEIVQLNASKHEQSSKVEQSSKEALQTQTEDLNRTIEALTNELQSIKDAYATQQSEYATTIQERDTILSDKSAKIFDLEGRVKSLLDDLESVRSDLETLRSDKNVIKTMFEDQIAEVQDNERTINTLKAEIETLQKHSNDTITKLKESVNEKSLELSASKMCVDDLRDKLRNNTSASSDELTGLQNKCKALEQSIEFLNEEVRRVQGELATEKSAHAELLKEKETIIFENSSHITKLDNQISGLNEELTKIRIESNEIITQTQNELLNEQTKHKEAQTTVQIQQEQLLQNVTNSENIEALESLRSKSQDLEEMINTLTKENQEAKVQLDKSQTEFTKLLDEHNTSCVNMQQEYESLQLKSIELDKAIKTLTNENVEVKAQLAKAQAEFADTLQKHNATSDSLQQANAELFETNKQLHQEMESLLSKSQELNEIIKTLTQENKEVKTQLGKSQIEIDNLLDKRNSSSDSLRQENAELSEAYKRLNQEIESLKSNSQELDEIIKTLTHKNEEVKAQLAEAQAEFADTLEKHNATLFDDIKKLRQESDETIKNLNAEIDQLRQDNQADIQDVHQAMKQEKLLRLEATSELQQAETKSVAEQTKLQQLIEEKDHSLKSKQLEMEDLLSEMRELNEALRNRGDIISKQEQKITGLNAEVAEKLKYVESLRTEHEQLSERLREVESLPKIHDISDQLSTSTVSRIEELSRMRDVDDSFEEKYNKLRSIAVRLKKKLSEQTKRIEELESATANTEAVQVATTTVSQAATISKSTPNASGEVHLRNLQQLQKQNDQLQDDLDAIRAAEKRSVDECAQLAKKLTELTAELSAMKMINEEIKNSAAVSGNQKNTLDQAIKEYVKQISSLKEELASEKKQKQAADETVVQLKETIQHQDDELTKLTTELKKVKSTVKKSNVLNLEMEAQEKSLIDISQKLEIKNLQVDELNMTIKRQEESVASLKHQIHLLEQTVASEKEHALDLKQQLDLLQARLKETEHDKSELKIRLDEAQHEKSAAQAELIERRLNAEQSSTENEKCLALFRSENTRHLQKISVLDETISDLTTKLRNTEQELVDLKTEFVAYKVRAQSMLRANQQKESSREIELEDELATVQGTIDALKTKLKSALEQNKSLNGNLADLRLECDRLQAHSNNLMHVAEESRLNVESLQEEMRRQNIDHQEALKSQRLQIDTLNLCYKKEIAELTEKYERDIQAKSQQIRVQDENRNSRSILGDAAAPKIGGASTTQRSPPTTDEQRIDWLLMERQDAEGSESNPPQSSYSQQRKHSTTRGRRDVIPLDELLNSSFEATTYTDGSSSPTFDLQATKDRLHIQESRVKHLTTLLAEAEQDTARLTQLNDALKEEVRRQERSAEREKHLHNLEYLKNVMFKFLTIHNGDEKVHLVPVLNTMLKLSPEEAQKLQNVAKGVDTAQRGWRGFLPV